MEEFKKILIQELNNNKERALCNTIDKSIDLTRNANIPDIEDFLNSKTYRLISIDHNGDEWPSHYIEKPTTKEELNLLVQHLESSLELKISKESIKNEWKLIKISRESKGIAGILDNIKNSINRRRMRPN